MMRVVSFKLLKDFISRCYQTVEFIGEKHSILSVTENSSEASAGSLFICIKGALRDGHDFAQDAYERGCRCFMCERALSLPEDALQIRVKNLREGLFGFLSRYYDIEEKDFSLCAVTGTKGKTSTACILTHLLNQGGYKAACSTTLGLYDGEGMCETKNTTPDLFTILPWLLSLKRKGVRYVIIEASSAALATGRIWGMHFEVGILTSFSKDHVGQGEHASMAEYLCAKRSLFTEYGIKTAIFPEGVYRGEFIVSDAPHVVALERDESAIRSVEEREIGQSFICRGQKMELPLPGAHNRTNARLALRAAAVLTGREESDFYSSLASVRIPGRYEEFSHKGIRVVIDYAHNYESFIAVAEAASRRSRGRLLAVFGSVGDRGEQRRAALAEAAGDCMDYSVITADDPGSEGALHICAQIYAAFEDKTRACIVWDRAAAIRHAFSICRAGDTLLLLGKGHERAQRYANESIPLSEREIVLSI